MDDHCDICDLPRSSCAHGLQERQFLERRARKDHLLISPANMAHFEGCDHKGDSDFSDWAELDTPGGLGTLGERRAPARNWRESA
jgi:hypothetical protein